MPEYGILASDESISSNNRVIYDELIKKYDNYINIAIHQYGDIDDLFEFLQKVITDEDEENYNMYNRTINTKIKTLLTKNSINNNTDIKLVKFRNIYLDLYNELKNLSNNYLTKRLRSKLDTKFVKIGNNLTGGKQSIHMQKYLKYKNKYLNLKNEINNNLFKN